MKLLRGSQLSNQIWRGECCHCDAMYEAKRFELQRIVTPAVHEYELGHKEYALEGCTECEMGHLSTVKFEQVPFHTIVVEPPTSEEVSKG